MNNKKKVIREIKRKCPECDGVLEIVHRIQKDNGVSYSCKYEECKECDYRKKINNKHDRVEKFESDL